jgi:hypothetical protein
MAAPVNRPTTPVNKPIRARTPAPAEAERALAQLRDRLNTPGMKAEAKMIIQARIEALMNEFPTLK